MHLQSGERHCREKGALLPQIPQAPQAPQALFYFHKPNAVEVEVSQLPQATQVPTPCVRDVEAALNVWFGRGKDTPEERLRMCTLLADAVHIHSFLHSSDHSLLLTLNTHTHTPPCKRFIFAFTRTELPEVCAVLCKERERAIVDMRTALQPQCLKRGRLHLYTHARTRIHMQRFSTRAQQTNQPNTHTHAQSHIHTITHTHNTHTLSSRETAALVTSKLDAQDSESFSNRGRCSWAAAENRHK